MIDTGGVHMVKIVRTKHKNAVTCKLCKTSFGYSEKEVRKIWLYCDKYVMGVVCPFCQNAVAVKR